MKKRAIRERRKQRKVRALVSSRYYVEREGVLIGPSLLSDPQWLRRIRRARRRWRMNMQLRGRVLSDMGRLDAEEDFLVSVGLDDAYLRDRGFERVCDVITNVFAGDVA